MSLARAIAAERETDQPVATVRHVHISGRPLVFIPLALADEANAPLAAMAGTDPQEPTLLVVPEPRDRDQRFAFAAELAGLILPYVQSHVAAEEPTGGREPGTRYADAPQLVVPNPAAVAFTRLLGRSTRFRRTEGEYAVAENVPVLGRWLTFFTERAEHPASSIMLAATEALALHWATGQSPVEDLNLGAILGWIAPPVGQSGARAAAAAEDPVRCPPAGPATDPTFDNEVLEHRISAVRTARFTGRGYDQAKAALTEALATQLAPTWTLMWSAVGLLRGLPEGGHVQARWDADKDAFTWHARHVRDGGPPQPRRDGAVSAARRLASLERIQQMVAAQRAFDDPLIMAEHRLAGEAFAGQVVAAEPDRVDATGKRPRLPVGRLAASDYIPSERVAAHEHVTVSTKVPDLSGCRVLLSTAHKWATVSADTTWPWAIVDEAYQMRSDLLLRIAGRFDRALFVGDPGQLDPFSAVQTERWTGLTWDPMQSAVAVLLRHNPDVPVHALPVSWRLPESAATVVAQAFYPFTGFRAATGAEQRRVAFSTSPFGNNSFDLAVETAATSGWALYELPARHTVRVIVLHPLSGRRDATAFHLEAGRLCVLTTRHRHACIVVARAGIPELLDAHPSTEPVHLNVPVKFPDGWEANQSIMSHLQQWKVKAP